MSGCRAARCVLTGKCVYGRRSANVSSFPNCPCAWSSLELSKSNRTLTYRTTTDTLLQYSLEPTSTVVFACGLEEDPEGCSRVTTPKGSVQSSSTSGLHMSTTASLRSSTRATCLLFLLTSSHADADALIVGFEESPGKDRLFTSHALARQTTTILVVNTSGGHLHTKRPSAIRGERRGAEGVRVKTEVRDLYTTQAVDIINGGAVHTPHSAHMDCGSAMPPFTAPPSAGAK